MSIEKVKEYFKTFGIENRILEFDVSSATVELAAQALGCEGCDICEKCTYPDAPCRFPEKAIPSIEACGISVVELSKLIGLNYNNGPCTVTYFCMILF